MHLRLHGGTQKPHQRGLVKLLHIALDTSEEEIEEQGVGTKDDQHKRPESI